MEEKEQICFQIISEAGMARSCFSKVFNKCEKQTKEALSAIESGKVIITKRILLIGNWYSKKHKVIKFGCRCY